MRTTLVAILILSLFACKKADERACVKSVGDEITKEISVEDFNMLYLGPHLRFTLVQDTVNRVILTGGEHIVSFVDVEVIDGKLFIKNENKCNFLRSYKKKIEAEVHLKKVQNIEYDATEPTYCENELQTDYLSVTINESAGRFHLNVNAQVLQTVVNRNWGNFELEGNVQFYQAHIRGNAFGNTYGLNVSDSIHVITRSGEDLDINADGALLRVQILSSGNVGFIGIPTIIDYSSFGEGKLLDKN